MVHELAVMANGPSRGSVPGSEGVADGDFNSSGWAMGSSGVAFVSPIPTLHATPEILNFYWQWMAFKRQLITMDFGTNGGTKEVDAALPASVPLPTTLDGLSSWEATVPVAAYSLIPSSPNVPAGFPITELRGIPKAGLDHFDLATSSNGKPLYGAYVLNSQGEPSLQQLFEFSRTAFEAGVFVPLPTVGGHFQGLYGLDYARHRFCGSIDSPPQLLRWGPTSPTSVLPHQHDGGDSLPTLPQREIMDDPDAVSSQLVASSSNDFVSFKGTDPHVQLPRVPNASATRSLTSSCTNQGMSSRMTSEHPLQRVPVPVKAAAPSALRRTTTSSVRIEVVGGQGVRSSRKSRGKAERTQAVAKRVLPDCCHPCFLCASCKEHWQICGLPEKHFENPRKEVFRPREEEVPITLSSEKTAARKRKWSQCRHGPRSKTSEYRGVNLYKRTWKWEAHIWHRGEQLYLGASITKTHAAEVYDRAALFLFGPDAEINFKPERYQKEFEFMQRLTYAQMVVYLRRESRQNGEEVRYPGVAKVKPRLFAASYRPRKEKESHEHIGYFKTEDEAVRAVLKEARRRRNYEMAGKILDVHHVRTVKPATGKIKLTGQVRAACVVAAIKVAASPPSEGRPATRAQRGAAKRTPAIQTQAAAIPTQDVAIAPPKRTYVRKNAKPKPSLAAKDTATVPMSNEAPRSQETGAIPSEPLRKYIRQSTKTQEKSGPKRSTQGRPLPAGDVFDSAPVAVAVEALPSQEAGVAPKRKATVTKSNSLPAAKRSAPGSTSTPVVTRPGTRLQQEATAPETGGEEAPPASPAPLLRPRPRKTSTPTRFESGISSPKVLPNATPESMTVAPGASPIIMPPAAQIPVSSAYPSLRYQAPVVYDFMPGGLPDSNCSTTSQAGSQAHAANRELGEPSRAPDRQGSGSPSSSFVSFQSTGPVTQLSYQTPDRTPDQTPPRAVGYQQPREEEMRHFQEVCNWMTKQRHNSLPAGFTSPRLSASISSRSPGVIRPVARRLSLTNNWTHQAGTSDAASGVAPLSVNLFPLERQARGQLYVDLFGPSAIKGPLIGGGDSVESMR